MQMLGCEKYRQMAKGDVAERIAVASAMLPFECADEINLLLSKDENQEVRHTLATNTHLGDNVCRVLGRLHKDKNMAVQQAVLKNTKFNTDCDGQHEMDYTIEPWYGFDVKRAEANCKNGCNVGRLVGELEAQDVDVVAIKEWKREQTHILRDFGFDFIPSKVSWQIKTSDYHGSFDAYLQSIKKGDYIRRRLRHLEKENIYFIERRVDDSGEVGSNYYKQWYDIYTDAMQKKKRGRLIIKEDAPPKHLTAIYAVKDGDTVLGGILFNASKPGVISGGYGAFLRSPPGMTDVAMARMVEVAIAQQPFNKNNEMIVNLGMDTNFYGFHLGTGLYSFKTSLGYVPRQFRAKREYFKVLNDKKFDDPYMYLSFPSFVDEWDEDFESFGLQNNIFVKGDAKVYLNPFDAPEGISIHHNGKKQRYHDVMPVDYFQNGTFATDYISKVRGDA